MWKELRASAEYKIAEIEPDGKCAIKPKTISLKRLKQLHRAADLADSFHQNNARLCFNLKRWCGN